MPPSKPRRTARVDKRFALRKRLTQIRAEVGKLQRDRAAVKREEFDEMSKALRQLARNNDELIQHTKSLATQFTRIAQIQAEVDLIKHALKKANLLDL